LQANENKLKKMRKSIFDKLVKNKSIELFRPPPKAVGIIVEYLG